MSPGLEFIRGAPGAFSSPPVATIAALTFVFRPVTRFSLYFSGRIKTLLGLESGRYSFVSSRDDIGLLFKLGMAHGVIDADHHDYITEILSFNRVTAYEVMTPLIDVVSVERKKGIRHVVRLIEETRFSRIPVYEERVDNIVGYVYYRDLLMDTAVRSIDQVLKEPHFVPSTKKIHELFHEMREMTLTMVFVVNEFGAVEGLVTREDIAEEIVEIAKELGTTPDAVSAKIDALHELNPMLGHRGCRLPVTYPEIAEMQTRAVIEAAIEVSQEKGFDIHPEIMIPLVGDVKELAFVRKIVVETADKVMAEKGVQLSYKVGTMIEIPRAAVTADKIATEAEFFSFGTNDLTQMTFGFSRDDAGKFLESYYAKKIFEADPFERLDQVGVGKLVEMAATLGRQTRPDIKLGICGEHGGDPSSIEFCHRVGLDYVSCSPFRVPIARLAAAHAAIKEKNRK